MSSKDSVNEFRKKFNESNEHIDAYLGEVRFVKGYKGFDEYLSEIEEFIAQARLDAKNEMIEKVKRVMNGEMAKKLGDSFEVFTGNRHCTICGYEPEFQRDFLLDVLEGKPLKKEKIKVSTSGKGSFKITIHPVKYKKEKA